MLHVSTNQQPVYDFLLLNNNINSAF